MLIIDKKDHIYPSADYQFFKKRFPDSYQVLIDYTHFLDAKATIKERMYCYHHNIQSKQTCKSCKNAISFHRKKNTYATFCSAKCSKNDPEVQQKYEKTCMKRYGVSNSFQSEEIKEKIKKTNIEQYGYENPNQSKEIRRKIEATNIERYGVKNPMHNDECKAKLKQTNLKRHGVEYPTQSEEIRKKIKQTFDKKYNGHYNQRHIPEDVLYKLNDEEWMYQQHVVSKISLLHISYLLDVSDGTIARYMNKHGIPISQQFNISYSEKELLAFIKCNYSGEIISNDRNIIKPMELDIVLPDEKIAIEYCGLYWHSNIYKDKNYHLNKLEACNKAGYRLITIFEDEWEYNKNLIKDKLLYIFGLSIATKAYARSTILSIVDQNECKEFLNKNHIQGSGNGSIRIGLYQDDILISCMVFRRFKDDFFEITRFASSNTVVGGFSKLLTYFKRNYDWNEIYTFADRRWSEGDLYIKTGFEIDKILKPDYRYIESEKRIHKFNFRHDRLSKKLGDKYDPELSEIENTDKNGINRIYDCGLIKFAIQNHDK